MRQNGNIVVFIDGHALSMKVNLHYIQELVCCGTIQSLSDGDGNENVTKNRV